ncbi:MAG: dihydrodipicolinate synthase family protein [Candidatus Bathyarchaeota archaeon]|nr:dihydrodipicolinate synthase family protein [Candidatus Bathyarchaeota archaeon]
MGSLRLGGIIPATVLPLTERYEIDEDSLREYIKWLTKPRVGGLAVNVDTGEGPHLYMEEKVKVIEIVKDTVGDTVPIVSGLQASFTSQAVEVADTMKCAGADALLVFPIATFYGSPLPPEVPYAYHKTVADKAKVPLVLFQLQKDLGGAEYSPECLSKLATIEEVIAIKEASFDAMKFLKTLRLLRSLPKRIAILTGNDNFIFESMVMGADGALIGFGTLATDLQVEMFELVEKERYSEAREIADRLQPLADVIFSPPVRNYRSRTKEALVMLGVLRHAHMRPPLVPISDQERAVVRAALKKAELL